MAKKQTVLSDELKAAIEEAARAGAYEAYKVNVGSYVNYFKAMESLLYNYKKLEVLVADEEAYCEVEYHAGKKTFAATPTSKGYYQQKTEADIIEELQEERRRQFRITKFGFESLKKAFGYLKIKKNSRLSDSTISARI